MTCDNCKKTGETRWTLVLSDLGADNRKDAMSSRRDTYHNRARQILQEAWEINGAPDIEDQMEVELRTLNGLLAIALTEFTAKPVEEGRSNVLGGAMIGLRDVMSEIDRPKTKPHVVNPGPGQALRCSVDNGYLDAQDSPPTRLKCEICGRIYEYATGEFLG